MSGKSLDEARESIFKESQDLAGVQIRGYDFNQPFDLQTFLASFGATGFQGSNLGKAIEILRAMKKEREAMGSSFKLYLGFTSNQISSGNREIIRYLVEHNCVDVIVTTAGGVEEDFIKCLKPFVLGDFRANGAQLRERGINRTGNIFVPNDRYIAFEQFVNPILDELAEAKRMILSPSELIQLLGERINNTESIYYWAAKHKIPVFCPALVDGSLGDICFFHDYNKRTRGESTLVLDTLADNDRNNRIAIEAQKTGMFVIGAGLVKHHILQANMMREGADYSVYLNTSAEFDGSDSGAEPEEAKSWGKVAAGAQTVKVVCDATIALPLLVAATWQQ